MTDSRIVDIHTDEDYDEDEDSDFDAGNLNDGGAESSSSSDDGEDKDIEDSDRPKKRRKLAKVPQPDEDLTTLDSGDEATIKEHKKIRRKQKKSEEDVHDDSDQEQGWRAKTRAMRGREKDEKKKTKLASSTGSAVDVEKLWEEMNRPSFSPSPVSRSQNDTTRDYGAIEESDTTSGMLPETSDGAFQDQENKPSHEVEEMITIRRKYKFAGEVHTEEKIVPKSSAEARLWLSQQDSSKVQDVASDGRNLRRPLRRISRFDPNLNSLDLMKKSWTAGARPIEKFKGKKINTVEKSKMDWVAHVDAEGLQEELEEHAKSKEAYHNRRDFLDQVEHVREEDARQARLKG